MIDVYRYPDARDDRRARRWLESDPAEPLDAGPLGFDAGDINLTPPDGPYVSLARLRAVDKNLSLQIEFGGSDQGYNNAIPRDEARTALET